MGGWVGGDVGGQVTAAKIKCVCVWGGGGGGG